MGDIPEDINIAACEMLDASNVMVGPNQRRNVERLICHAILAERQRCADVAKAYLEDIEGCDMKEDEPELIAAAILYP